MIIEFLSKMLNRDAQEISFVNKTEPSQGKDW